MKKKPKPQMMSKGGMVPQKTMDKLKKMDEMRRQQSHMKKCS